MPDDTLRPVQIYCSNCAKKLIGWEDERGGIRFDCDKCGVLAYSKKMKQNEYILKVRKK